MKQGGKLRKIFLFFMISNLLFARELSFEKAIEIAKENNRGLKRQELTLKQKILEKNSNSKEMLPTISIKSSYEKLDNQLNDEKYKNSLVAKQPIFVGGEKYNNFKIAGYREDLERINLYNQDNILRIDVLENYIKCLYEKEILAINEKSYQDKKEELKRQIEFRNLGLIDKTEVLKLETSIYQTEGKIIESRNNLISGELSLKTILKISLDEEIKLEDLEISNLNIEKINLEKDIKNALKNGVISRQYNKNIDIKEREAKKKLSEFLPKINAEYSYSNINQDNFKSSTSGHQDDWEWSLGLSFEWELFNFGSSQDDYKVSKIEIEKIKLERDEELDNLRKNIVNYYNNILTLKKTFETNKKAYETSDETYKIEKEKYENRMIDTIDYLKAEENMMVARADYYKSKLNYFLAYEKYMMIIK